jgi:hypothetical protein
MIRLGPDGMLLAPGLDRWPVRSDDLPALSPGRRERVVRGLRTDSRQDTPENPSLFTGDTSRVNQIIDLLDASRDGLVLARESRVAGDQSHRLGEPLEIRNGIHRS